MIHDEPRVEALLAAAETGIQACDELLGKTTDPGFYKRLTLNRYWFEDIESFFLAELDRRDRTPEAEARWLDSADVMLAVSNQMLRQHKKIFDDYGPGVMCV